MSDEELNLTAKAWLLMQNSENKYWRSYNPMQKYEFASLTKMYTLQACLDINDEFNIKPELCWIQILQSTQCGTQAGLLIGNYLTLEQVYYGLMLPSGNDAALNLAYYYGYFLGRKDKFYQCQWTENKYFTIQGKKKYGKIYLARFVSYMNKQLVKEKLGHDQTHFQNPHGLSDKLQKSSPWQLANAAMHFLKNPKFCQIVQTQTYTATYRDNENQVWQNTNLLLKQGYIGIKTGHTVTAGSCLCSRKIIYHNRKKYDLVLVLLGCKSQEDRFIETQIILKDFIKYLKMMNP